MASTRNASVVEGNFLIIDTDCGVDDALAIMLALDHDNTDVKAITCCHGNTTLENVWGNVYRVLKICGRLDISVYPGADKPLLGGCKDKAGDCYHGTDGFGGIAGTIPVDNNKPHGKQACVAMVELANQYPHQITIVALAPLTNLALAMRIDPQFTQKIRKVEFMGGNHSGLGNVTAAAEFNFDRDPEAAAMVLQDLCPKLCMPWETCIHNPLPWDTYNKLTNLKTGRAQFVKKLTAQSVELAKSRKRTGYHSCDLFAMAAFLYPNIVEEQESLHAVVELNGTHTRGQMVVERRPWIATSPNVRFITKLNQEQLTNIIQKMLEGRVQFAS